MATKATLETDDDEILGISEFVGNTVGNKGKIPYKIKGLAEGMKIDEAIKRLKGIPCGFRPTSCPDQLSIALEEAKNNMNK